MNKFEYVSWSKRDFDLPRRATKNSAGYDFYSPIDGGIKPGEILEFSLEVKVRIKPFEFLLIVPRSSLGFKGTNFVTLTNTVGVIDIDYYYTKEEGEIRLKLKNFGDKPFTFKKNDRLVQGIFLKYDITDDDNPVSDERIGGLGSTGQ